MSKIKRRLVFTSEVEETTPEPNRFIYMAPRRLIRGAVSSGPPVPTDPDFANVSLLLHAEGADGSTTLLDSSSLGLSFSASGNAQLDTSQFKFGGSSMQFDGAGDYFLGPTSTGLAFGNGDFTIELFARFGNLSGVGLILEYANGSSSVGNYAWQIQRNGSQIQAMVSNGSSYLGTASGTVAANQWYYIVMKRSGSNLITEIDGVATNTTSIGTTTVNNPSGASLRIGMGAGSWAPLLGWLDEVRITKGVARTTSTIPTAAFPDS